jgi:Zn-dependent alcohol dehydrogenase
MTTTTTMAVYAAGDETVRLRDAALPDPGPHEVLVRMLASGICRSQLVEMSAHEGADPLPLGHEALAVVEQAGSAVQGFAVGSRVIVTWVPAAGEGIRAAENATVAFADGGRSHPTEVYTWATHALVDELYLVAAEPDDADPALALIGCAATTGVGAAMYAGDVRFGDSVAIIGVGGVGLAAVLGARAAGAARIIVIDVDAAKLDFARTIGATDTLDATRGDPVAAVRALVGRLGQRGADVVIDCVGSTGTIAQAVAAARPALLGAGDGGRIVLAGLGGGSIAVSSYDLVMEQKSIIGTLAGGADRAGMVRMLAAARDGRLDVGALVTETLPFADIVAGVARLRAGQVLGRSLLLF